MKSVILTAVVLISGITTIPLVVGNTSVITHSVEIVEDLFGIHSETQKVDEQKEDLQPLKSINDEKTSPNTTKSFNQITILKDVGEAYMENFGLTETDFQIMRSMNIDVIEGNFDICAGESDVKYLLDQSSKYGIKVIMNAGSGEAEWGYECNADGYPATQKPVWDKEAVVEWVNKWKTHPALYAWDTSNEAGSVFPNPSDANMLTVDQLKQAYRDVKATDTNHPIMIRMNGWYFYDYTSNFFREGNPFANNVADIVMVNAYSNVDEYFEDFVYTVTTRSVSSIRKIDADTKIFIALGAWKEPPLWSMPTVEHLRSEVGWLRNNSDVSGIGYFKYGAKGSEWYLPNNASNLLKVISDN